MSSSPYKELRLYSSSDSGNHNNATTPTSVYLSANNTAIPLATSPGAGVGLSETQIPSGVLNQINLMQVAEAVERAQTDNTQNNNAKQHRAYLEEVYKKFNPTEKALLIKLGKLTDKIYSNGINHELGERSCAIAKNMEKKGKEYIDELTEENKKIYTAIGRPDLIYKQQKIYKSYKNIHDFIKYLSTDKGMFNEKDKRYFYILEIASDICKHYTALSKAPLGLHRRAQVYIYFMRHSESCANVMKKNVKFGKIRQTFYTDPELSHRGEKMAEDMAEKFFAEGGTYSQLKGTSVPKAMVAGPRQQEQIGTVFGASSLIRAQQTAKYMLGAATAAEHRIYKRPDIFEFPYIHEVGSGEENKPMTNAQRNQRHVAVDHVIKSHLQGLPNLDKSNITKFLDWLGKNFLNIYEKDKLILPANDNPYVFQMIIVTHHGVLKQLMKQFGTKTESGTKIEFNNLDGIEFSIEYDEYGNRIDTKPIGPVHRYVPPPTIPLSCPESENTACRKPVCGVPYKDRPQSICDLIAAAKIVAERVPDKNRIRNNRTNKKHRSKLITLHPSHPIQDIDYNTHIEPLITAIHKNRALFPQADTSNLEKYKKPGYFSRKVRRNMNYLYEDLNDISYAVNCESRPIPPPPQMPPSQTPHRLRLSPVGSKTEMPSLMRPVSPPKSPVESAIVIAKTPESTRRAPNSPPRSRGGATRKKHHRN